MQHSQNNALVILAGSVRLLTQLLGYHPSPSVSEQLKYLPDAFHHSNRVIIVGLILCLSCLISPSRSHD